MAKFCGKCGSSLDVLTGKCPNCDKITEEAKLSQQEEQAIKEAEKEEEKAQKAAAKEEEKAKKEAEKAAAKEEEKVNKRVDKAAEKAKEKVERKAEKTAAKAEKKAREKAIKKEAFNQLPFKVRCKKIAVKYAVIAVLIAILAGVFAGTLAYFNIIESPFYDKVFDMFGMKKTEEKAKNDKKGGKSSGAKVNPDDVIEDLGEYKITPMDADEYYEDNSDVLEVTEVSDSEIMYTESDVYAFLEERGFADYPITTTYSTTGEYSEPDEISSSSSKEHPVYEVLYVAANGDKWTVTVTNSTITAYPLTYNENASGNVQTIISESESIISYNSRTNKFYETIPHKDVLQVKVVTLINAETLESLTSGEIEKL